MADQSKHSLNRTKKSADKKEVSLSSSYKIFLGLQFFASVLFLFLALSYLPFLYLAGGIILLSLLLFVTYFLILSNTHQAIRMFGRILSVMLSVCLAVGSVYVYKATHFLNQVSDAKTETMEVSVAVLKNSSFTSLSDVAGSMIGYNAGYDEEIIPAMEELISKETGLTPILDPYSQYKYLASDLYNEKVNAILFNENHRALIKTTHGDFDDVTKNIGTFTVTCEEKLAASAVNDISSDCFIVYISGIDTRGEVSVRARTDANMLAVINPTTHQVLLLCIPRDYYVTIPFHGQKDKLTHSGLYGINSSIDTLNLLLNTNINYYARVNFRGTRNIINAMDGVDVYSPVAFTTLDGKYKIKKGMNHMKGKKALYFMRSRKMLSGGDNDRVSNQIRVLKTLISKLCNPAVFTSSYTKIMAAMKNNVHTNMTSTELNDLIQLQITKMPRWDINNYQLEGTGSAKSSGSFLMLPDEESVEKAKILIDQMLSGQRVNLEKIDEPLVDFINAIENPDYSNHESESERQSQ